MIRRVVLALFVAVGLAGAGRAAERPVPFSSDPASPAMRAAITALRASHPGENIRLSTVQAAFVRLVDGAAPQLVVTLEGGYCGSAGCSISLYERGTNGWVTLNDWLASSIGVAAERTGVWHNIVLNHDRPWVMRGGRYEPQR